MGTRIPSVRDATRTDKDRGGGAYTVNRDTPFRPGQTSFSWRQDIFPMGTKRELRSDGFVFSRLTVAACALPAGNQVHGSDSSLSAAISWFRPPNTLKPLRGAQKTQKKTRLLSVCSVCRRRRLSVCSLVFSIFCTVDKHRCRPSGFIPEFLARGLFSVSPERRRRFLAPDGVRGGKGLGCLDRFYRKKEKFEISPLRGKRRCAIMLYRNLK